MTIVLAVGLYIEIRGVDDAETDTRFEESACTVPLETTPQTAQSVEKPYLVLPPAALDDAEPDKLEKTGEIHTADEEYTELDAPEYTEYEESYSGMTYAGSYWVTGYDICVECCGNTDGICASGAAATVGRTVAAGEEFAFGTVLYIEGIGYRTVEDRGGAVGNGVLDVLCSDHESCGAITGYRDVYVVG